MELVGIEPFKFFDNTQVIDFNKGCNGQNGEIGGSWVHFGYSAIPRRLRVTNSRRLATSVVRWSSQATDGPRQLSRPFRADQNCPRQRSIRDLTKLG